MPNTTSICCDRIIDPKRTQIGTHDDHSSEIIPKFVQIREKPQIHNCNEYSERVLKELMNVLKLNAEFCYGNFRSCCEKTRRNDW